MSLRRGAHWVPRAEGRTSISLLAEVAIKVQVRSAPIAYVVSSRLPKHLPQPLFRLPLTITEKSLGSSRSG